MLLLRMGLLVLGNCVVIMGRHEFSKSIRDLGTLLPKERPTVEKYFLSLVAVDLGFRRRCR